MSTPPTPLRTGSQHDPGGDHPRGSIRYWLAPFSSWATRHRGLLELGVGQAAFAITQGLTLIAMARLEGARAVGLYTWALAVVSPAFLLGQFGLQDVLGTDPGGDQRAPGYLRVTVFGAGLALLASVGTAAVLGRPEYVVVTLLLGLAKCGESISHLVYGRLQGTAQFGSLARRMTVRGGVALVAVVAGMALGGLELGMVMVAVGWLVVAVVDLRVYPVPVGAAFAQRPSLAVDGRAVLALAPLGAATMLVSVNQSVVRLVVEHRVGLAELGLYATVAYAVRIGAVSTKAVVQGMSPALRGAVGRGDRRAVDRLGRWWAWRIGLGGAALTLLGSLVGPAAYAWVFGPAFRPPALLIACLLAGGTALFVGMPFSMSLVTLGSYRPQFRILVVTVALTLVLALALSGPLGSLGAAIGWACGEAVRTLLLVRESRRAARASGRRTARP